MASDRGLIALVHVGDLDDGEFVAAEPGNHVGASAASSQAAAAFRSKFADRVSERVIDRLEPVEVEHQDRERPLVPPLVRIDVMELFEKERPVR